MGDNKINAKTLSFKLLSEGVGTEGRKRWVWLKGERDEMGGRHGSIYFASQYNSFVFSIIMHFIFGDKKEYSDN